MNHVILTCRHHPELRWQCKSIAFSPEYGYNGLRNIFFLGVHTESGNQWQAEHTECSCPPTDLVFAPEEQPK